MKPYIALPVLLAVLAGCNPQPQHGLQTPTPAATPTTASTVLPIRIHGRGTSKRPIKIVDQQGNRKLYELLAKSSEGELTQAVQARFEDTHVTFYDKSGSTMVADSPVTTVDERHHRVVMSGDVHAKSSTGMTLICDILTYDSKSGMIHGDGNVRITGTQGGAQQTLTGNSFDSDLKFTQMRIQ
ncbi:MAG: LPS export ABC transporter periplasmic protein LptC [Vulcanimicrobiaceae bacterium]